MCKCRNFEFAKNEGSSLGKHYSIKSNLLCPLCICKRQKWSRHGSDGDYRGNCLECENCHDYIRYTTAYDELYKEEFYFDENNITVMFEYDNDPQCCVIKNDNMVYMPIFEFQNREQLFNKIKTYILFS